MKPWNSDFVVRPIKVGKLPAGVPSKIVPERLGEVVEFVTGAPSWLVAGMRNVLIDYVVVKHLRLAPGDGSFTSDDKAIQQPYVERHLACVICHESAAVGGQYRLNFQNRTTDLVALMMGQFVGNVETGASDSAFEKSIYFHYLHPGCSIQVTVEVVEEAGWLQGIKGIVTNFRYSTPEIVTLSLSRTEIDKVWEKRWELDVPPFNVTMQLHGDRTLKSLFEKATKIVMRVLDGLLAKLADGQGLRVEALNVGGRGYSGYAMEADEPRGHVLALLCDYINGVADVEGKFWLQCKHHFNAITNKYTIEAVCTGSAEEIRKEYIKMIGELKGYVGRWNSIAE